MPNRETAIITPGEHIQNKAPWEIAYNPNGQIFNTPDNPLMEISPDAGYTKNENLSAIANLALEWSVPYVPGLRLKALGNYRINNDKSKSWKKSPLAYDWMATPTIPANLH